MKPVTVAQSAPRIGRRATVVALVFGLCSTMQLAPHQRVSAAAEATVDLGTVASMAVLGASDPTATPSPEPTAPTGTLSVRSPFAPPVQATPVATTRDPSPAGSPPASTPTNQITQVPTGSVPAGDGSNSQRGTSGTGYRVGAAEGLVARLVATTLGQEAQERTPLVPAPAEPGTPAVLPASTPVRLHIPAIALDSELLALGLDDDGALEVPSGAHPAGWYDGSPTPGSLGPAIISGHVDHGGQVGVFYNLEAVAVGDEVAVERQDGTTAVFRVTRVAQLPKDTFPTEEVYGNLDHPGLRLITCGGPFDRASRSYRDNIVVFAELLSSH